MSGRIIVAGASAGGFEALRTLVGGLPAGLEASVFVVWHMSPDGKGVLPQVLNKSGTLYAAHAFDGERIEAGRIYVAPPDKHLLIENGHVRLTQGPKENRFRPAIDPLFRSAAYDHGPNVIGIILSGALDDGTSGLWTVKLRGGITIVQDPTDAAVPSMPESAIRDVEVDHVVTASDMPRLITELIARPPAPDTGGMIDETHMARMRAEIAIAAGDNALKKGVMVSGSPSAYACPDCHGVLSAIADGGIRRFRCHTGHAFSAGTLLAAVTENVEDSLWNAVRGIDEAVLMLNHLGDHYAEADEPRLAAKYFRKAKEAQERGDVIRQAIFATERSSSSDAEPGTDRETGRKPDADITNDEEKEAQLGRG